MIIALLFLILFAILFPKALRFLFALLFIGGIIALGEAHAADFATQTVMEWQLAARRCNIDNLKSRSCMREDELDRVLTSHGCTVDMAIWWCPITQIAGFRCDDAFDEKGAPIGCVPILPGKRSP